MDIEYRWRGPFTDDDVGGLHAEAFGHAPVAEPWRARLERHSLGWVTAREEDALVGFVNVVWDGGVHAFVLDTMVRRSHRGRGIGREVVAVAEREARAAGCEWLHVDYDDDLAWFYEDACGFVPAPAGLIQL